jgi:outer membrane protein assembly factor BamE (lipoprotein component of BamABCDE complex)
MIRLVFPILLAVGVVGCANFSGEFGTRIRVENLDEIVPGKTTRDEVLLLFGPPSGFFNPNFIDVILQRGRNVEVPAPVLNDVFTWRFIENDTRVFFIPFVLSRIDAGATYETLTIFFDDDGVVRYHAYRKDPARP